MQLFLEKIFPGFLVFLVICAGTVLRTLVTEGHRRKNDKAENIRTRATVLSKRMNCDNIAHQHLRDSGTVFYATFRTGDGSTVELMMSRNQYEALTEDSEGTLTYQRDRFVSFEP